MYSDKIKLLIIETDQHKNSQSVLDHIRSIPSIDEEAAFEQRLNRFLETHGLTEIPENLEEVLVANSYVQPHEAPIWEIEGYASEELYVADQYKRNRASEYPSYADQFDTIFHEGVDEWKAQIQAVKDKYPKPQ